MIDHSSDTVEFASVRDTGIANACQMQSSSTCQAVKVDSLAMRSMVEESP